MNEQNDTEARHRGLLFFGTISASVSHELNNVISIIDQVGGLLKDITAAAEAGYQINPDQLRTVHERIRKQTERGRDIIKSLNKYSHTVDDPVREFDLVDMVRNLTALSKRFAELKRVRLQTNFPEEEVRVTNDPFGLLNAVFLAYQWALEAGEREDLVTVEVSAADHGAQVSITGPNREAPQREIFLEKLRPLLDELGGAMENEIEGEDSRLVLRFPSRM